MLCKYLYTLALGVSITYKWREGGGRVKSDLAPWSNGPCISMKKAWRVMKLRRLPSTMFFMLGPIHGLGRFRFSSLPYTGTKSETPRLF